MRAEVRAEGVQPITGGSPALGRTCARRTAFNSVEGDDAARAPSADASANAYRRFAMRVKDCLEGSRSPRCVATASRRDSRSRRGLRRSRNPRPPPATWGRGAGVS